MVTDAYGGTGGIAQYARNLLETLSNLSLVDRVFVIPRVLSRYSETPPNNVIIQHAAANNNYQYLKHLIKRSLGRDSVNLVICVHINLLLFAVVAKFITRSRLVLVLHGYEIWQRPNKIFIDWLITQVDQVVPVSRFTRDKFISWSDFPESKIRIVPNAIDLEKFKISPKPHYLLERYKLSDKKVILTLGRLSAEEQAKGFDQIIKTLPRLLSHNPDTRYLIVGEGADTHRLQALAAQLEVSHAVIFSGHIPDHEKADHYHLADAYVMPSKLEGFGIVYLEAMACGIPVVGSAMDGSADPLMDGKLGTLINPDDLDQIYSAILNAVDKPKYIPPELESFSMANYQQKIRLLIESVVSGSF